MRRCSLIVGLCVLALSPLPLAACLWDSDTLATEAKGIPEVVNVITGRFERNPPLYYEMRLARVAKELESDPTRLELYDDAGVSCDRLGRDDEAIAWMEKKRVQLDKGEHTETETTDQRYRYHANLGTFFVHRWFKNGADRTKMEDVSAGRDHIAKAIKINPDAHFGREKYQLMVIDWILKPPKIKDDGYTLPTFLTGDSEFAYERPKTERIRAAGEAMRGLSGLIALGNAWESIDVFHALADAAMENEERTSVAFLARLRCDELIDAGKGSVLPGAPKGEALKQRLMRLSLERENETRDTYHVLRADADAWQHQRTEYMMARLKAGRHPDVSANFWDDFHPKAPPSLVSRLGKTKTYGLETPRTAFLRVVAPMAGALILTVLGVIVWVACSGGVKRARQAE